MAAYTPIVPFEVLSKQLSRAPEEIIKLDANENPYGPAPAVREALASYPYLQVYPDPEQRELRAALAEYTRVPAQHILPGHGADELIDLLSRITLGPRDAIVDCPPSFGMYSFDAALAGAQVIQVPRRADFRIDVGAIKAHIATATQGRENGSIPKLLFLTSPNNPTGELLDRADLERLLDLPLLVIVDEAYIEFAGLDHSVAEWVPARENLVVLRTFSKWAGIAGLRLGYGIFPSWLMPVLWKVKQPYNVNVGATLAGLVSLANRAEIGKTVAALVGERGRLFQLLAGVSFLEPFPSHANFILCRVVGRAAADLKAALAQRGILVRHYATRELAGFIRISVGRPGDTDMLIAALAEIERT